MDYDPKTGQAKAPTARRAKTRRAFSHGPKPASRAQWAKLAGELGCLVGQPGMESYVRFANGYHQGEISSIHLMHAIDLAIHGENIYGTSEDLARWSEEPDGWIDPETGDALPLGSKRAYQRHYGGFKRRGAYSEGSSASRLYSSRKGSGSGTSAPQNDHNITAAEELQRSRLLKVRELNMARVRRLNSTDDLKD